MEYQEKYYKYKNKYKNLKNLIAGEYKKGQVANTIEDIEKLYKDVPFTPQCFNIGFRQHYGECWNDSIQMFFLSQDGISNTVQRKLYFLTSEQIFKLAELRGRKTQCLPKMFYDSNEKYYCMKEHMLIFLDNLKARFKFHYNNIKDLSISQEQFDEIIEAINIDKKGNEFINNFQLREIDVIKEHKVSLKENPNLLLEKLEDINNYRNGLDLNYFSLDILNKVILYLKDQLINNAVLSKYIKSEIQNFIDTKERKHDRLKDNLLIKINLFENSIKKPLFDFRYPSNNKKNESFIYNIVKTDLLKSFNTSKYSEEIKKSFLDLLKDIGIFNYSLLSLNNQILNLSYIHEDLNKISFSLNKFKNIKKIINDLKNKNEIDINGKKIALNLAIESLKAMNIDFNPTKMERNLLSHGGTTYHVNLLIILLSYLFLDNTELITILKSDQKKEHFTEDILGIMVAWNFNNGKTKSGHATSIYTCNKILYHFNDNRTYPEIVNDVKLLDTLKIDENYTFKEYNLIKIYNDSDIKIKYKLFSEIENQSNHKDNIQYYTDMINTN